MCNHHGRGTGGAQPLPRCDTAVSYTHLNKYETVRTTEAYQGVFTIEVISTEFNKDYEKGVIYDQNPKAGRKVKSGTKIKVKVSGGQKMITLPSYISQEENEVYAKLKELGLHYETCLLYTSPGADANFGPLHRRVFQNPGGKTHSPGAGDPAGQPVPDTVYGFGA